MKLRYSIAFLFLLYTTCSWSQVLISSTQIASYTRGELILQGVFSAENGVDLYHITYNTIDAQSNPTIASGALAVPIDAICDSLPLVNYNHGTVLLKEDVPSRMSGEELVGLTAASEGMLTTMPDYLGLGDSPGLHPYQHAATEASATLDMIRASREFVLDSLKMILNGEVFLTGYSQGGHAAMATHKHIQENNLEAEFNVVASAPSSGAYDMSKTTADFIFSNAYSNPGYIVYIIEAYQMVYGNLYTNRADYYKSPYDTQILPYLTGDSTMASLNAILKPRVDSLLEDTVLTNYKASASHPLRKALMANDVYDWAPKVTVEMNYCEADEQVPFQNSIVTLDTMLANGATMVTAVSRGVSFNHGACVVPSLTSVMDLFSNLTRGCTPTGVPNLDISNDIRFTLYPNPASERIIIDLPSLSPSNKQEVVTITGIDGKIQDQLPLREGKNELNVSKYPKGIYFVQLRFSNQHHVEKLIIQ